MPVRLTGSRTGPDAFVLGATLRAVATAPRGVGVAVTWFGPRSWRLSITPASLNGPSADLDADRSDDDYRVAATVYVDFDEDEQGRRIARLATEPAADPFDPLRPVPPVALGEADESIGADARGHTPEPSVSATVRAERAGRAEVGAAMAVGIGRAFAVGLGAVSAPPSAVEDAATARGLAARPAPTPDPMWQAEQSLVTTLRTQLTGNDLSACLATVPFRRQGRAGSSPVIFTVGGTGHAAGQTVTLAIDEDTDATPPDGSTILLSYLVGSSGDPVVDAVVSSRARACVEAVCAAVLSADRWAVRDDGREDSRDDGREDPR